MYTIEQIEDAIITAVDGLKASQGVRTIKSYQGELEESDIKRLIALFPAIYVVYGGSTYAEHGARKIEKMTYHLFVCDKNLRAEDEARRGGTQNVGTYAMLDGVRDLLYGKQLSLEINPLALIRQTPVWFGGGISVYAAEYETSQSLLYPAT
ncbi:MAG: DUF1834 family protein [Spirochaetales bacterium]|jgi:phage gp37-like protein|nr:DUF1834 family protein [Spirochaetales bacterium]